MSVAASKKTALFEHLFQWRYDAAGVKSRRYDTKKKTIPEDRRLVYGDEVAFANRETGAGLKHNQPSSFAKDFLRKDTRNANWPTSLAAKRWSAKQIAGKDINGRLRNFVFIPYAEAQTIPFPDECALPKQLVTHLVQSVTMSVASKQIKRLDEARLMQIAADLRIVETHFALHSPLREQFDVLHIDLLQMGLKLRGAEIDGLYLAECLENDQSIPVLITVEAKKHDEFVVRSQIISQVEHASALGVKWNKIIPIALKHADGGLYLFEFAPFDVPEPRRFHKDSLDQDMLVRTADVYYKVFPIVPSLQLRPKRASRIASAKNTSPVTKAPTKKRRTTRKST